MASQLFFTVLLSALLCWQAALCQLEARCDLNSLPRADIQLSKFTGTWFEMRFVMNSNEISSDDVWSDYSEVYTMNRDQPLQLNRTYTFRDPQTGRCSSIASKYPMTYYGNGEFSTIKFGEDYVTIVAFVDRAYQYAVVVECSEMLESGECIHSPDVKVLMRNRKMTNVVEANLMNFFRANVPCVRYSDLLESAHSNSPCVLRNSTPTKRFYLQRESSWWQLESLRRLVSKWTNF